MKRAKSIVLLALLCLTGIGAASAHGHRHSSIHFGISIGGPGPYWGYRHHPYYRPHHYYPQTYYYYAPPPVIIERPVVYIEQPPAPPPASTVVPAAPTAGSNPAHNYWYYCPGSGNYYPYVQDCPQGWQQVVPYPTAQR